MSARLLLVEDEKKMSAFIQQGLQDNGFLVEVAENGHDALNLLNQKEFDLVIMDVMLPDKSGVEIVRQMKARGHKGLILMLTALNTTQDKITGLDAGADDYLTKPFDFAELMARVRALLRREAQQQHTLINGDLHVDLINRKVTREGQSIDLTSKEFALLELFMRHVDRILTRMTISEQVWGSEFDPNSNVIDVYVNHLRKKIDAPFPRKLLKTVVGHGYVLSKAD